MARVGFVSVLFVFLAHQVAPPALAVDHVVFEREGSRQAISGKLVVEAADGGLLMMTADGVLWTVEPDEIIRHTNDAQPFEPWDADEVSRRLLAELPEGFQVHATAHYVVCYNTSQAYAQWSAALLERLYRAFTNFWQRRGFELHDPELPLVALIFADADSYQAYAKAELGDAVGSIVAYYSLRSNRVAMYDLTGLEKLRAPGDRRGSPAEINRMLARPEAAPMVATIVHEATHQIAFNCGLHTRYSDVPLWVSEGVAMYFETPDLRSAQGWRGIGGVNRARLIAFRKNLPSRADGTLADLVADDKAMRNVRTAADAYAEAWALTYYLLRRHPRKFLAYVKVLSEKGPLVWDDREARLAEFRQAFGDELDKLEADLVRQMRLLR